MFGKGLLDGVLVTTRNIFRKRLTEKYPEIKPDLPERWRGSFQLDAQECITCGLCAKACPNHALIMAGGKNEDNKKYLLEYKLNRALCLYCGLCVEACPKKCLRFTHDFESATYFIEDIVLDLLAKPNLEQKTSTFAQGDPFVIKSAPQAKVS
ncbi:MAG: NADH-quinone oxidoreductase subunit I, partial [Clostridiales bacterium]